jgi:hypothetical protein
MRRLPPAPCSHDTHGRKEGPAGLLNTVKSTGRSTNPVPRKNQQRASLQYDI